MTTTQGGHVDHDPKILRRIRASIAQAEHPGTEADLAAASRAMADKLMARYGITAADLAPAAVVPSVRRPTSAPVVPEPRVVHLMSGFTSVGARQRAWCRCGYQTTPRASRTRALAALVAGHELDVPECVLCGKTYTDVDWVSRSLRLDVLTDPATGDEFMSCYDVLACGERRKAAL